MNIYENTINWKSLLFKEIEKYSDLDLGNEKAFEKPTQKLVNSYTNMTVPLKGRLIIDVLEEFNNNVIKYIYKPNHPRSFAFIPGPASKLSWMADIMTTANNIHASNFANASIPISIEMSIISYLSKKIGYNSKKSGGIFVSGGSMANLTALTAARDDKVDLRYIHNYIFYLSNQAHHSIKKVLHIIGIPNESIRLIDVDDNFKLDTEKLKQQMLIDKDKGLTPSVVIATAGTTNTGTVDDINIISDLCSQEGCWLHIDGAYGLSHILSPNKNKLFQGVSKSDSVSWDAHKLLFQNYSCAMVIVKDKKNLLNTYSQNAEYLNDIIDDTSLDPESMGIELSRPPRGLKLWFTLQTLGEEEIVKRIEYGVHLAEKAESFIRQMPNWDIVSSANLSIVNFRYNNPNISSTVNEDLMIKSVKKLVESGYALVYTTEINRIKSIRMCIINPETTQKDVETTLVMLNDIIVNFYKNLY